MDLKLINNNSLNFNPFIQLDHITSHGNEYIDTGVLPTDNIKLEMEFSFNSVSGCPYGTQTSSSTVQAFQLVLYSGSTYYMLTLGQGTSKPTLYANKRYHVEHKKGMQKLYDTADSSTLLIDEAKGNGTFSSSKSIYLFAKNSNSGVASKSSINLYWCKIYDGDVIIRDYIPSYNNSKFCLFDKITSTYYYNLGSDDFTSDISLGVSGVAQQITNLFIKDCPETDCIDVLRKITTAQTGIQTKLTRVRCNIGNVSGTLEELQYYATLNGYSDSYEEQTKPRIVGTFTISSYHTTAELEALDGLIDGLTIVSNSNYNINALISNDELAVQTFDENADNYNPAVAIKLNNANIGYVHTNPITLNGGRYLLRKTEAANCSFGSNAFFNNVTTLTDSNSIVSDDDTQTYDFESFDEFRYFTMYTSVPGGATNQTSLFGRCSKLQSIVLPSTVTNIGNYGFSNCTALNTITIPASCTSFGTNCFANTNSIASVYYEGTFENWINITFGNSDSTPCKNAGQLYIQNIPLTSISIPENTVTIKGYTFYSMPYITGQIIIPDSVTSIGTYAFNGLSNITLLHIPVTTTSNKINNSGKEGSTLIVDGDYTTERSYENIKFSNIIISGDLITGGNRGFTTSQNIRILRINGDYNSAGGNNILSTGANGALVKLIEVIGSITGCLYYRYSPSSGTIYHFGKNQIALTTTQFANYSANVNNNIINSASKFLVGDGTSRANDEAVLALYLADTNWATYSAKLATWYDYNGEYKWYYITDNLTNCTNTNPDEWPHITRGESYETTIVPDEGMTIDSLTVEMLDTDTTSPTYDTYVPQPTSYDSATGIYTISIPSVTGNVVITASAS